MYAQFCGLSRQAVLSLGNIRGNAVIFAVLIVFLCILLTMESYGTRQRAWSWFGVNALAQTFPDTRAVLGWVDCAKAGKNPYTEADCDWNHRLFNYPSTWLTLSHTSLTVNDTEVVGTAIGFAFFSSVLLAFRRSSLLEGFICGACIVSPAVLLGVERGNADLIIFWFLATAIAIASSLRRGSEIVLSVAILLCALLKLYPIAAIVTLYNKNKIAVGIAIAATILFSLWLLYSIDELKLIINHTPRMAFFSYGYPTFFITFVQGDDSLSPLVSTVALLTLVFIASIAIITGLAIGKYCKLDLSYKSPVQCQFLVGSTIYVATFSIGTNFNYKLVFLLLCIRQTSAWAVDPGTQLWLKSCARVLLAGIVAICWLSLADDWTTLRSNASSEIISWVIFGILLGLLTNHLSSQMPDFIQRTLTSIGALRTDQKMKVMNPDVLQAK
jgi:hypothetical protein